MAMKIIYKGKFETVIISSLGAVSLRIFDNLGNLLGLTIKYKIFIKLWRIDYAWLHEKFDLCYEYKQDGMF
jgi:hypothetical protein